jgi:hypothetical protein
VFRTLAWRTTLFTVSALLHGCGDNLFRDSPYFTWDETAAVGAFSIDRLAGDDQGMLATVDSVRDTGMVVLFYGHDPPRATSYEAVDGLLARAEQDGLEVLTFADLAAGGRPRAGICLSFDDNEIEAWYSLRALLARHRAHVSFFVTRYAEFTADQRSELHALFEDGHSIEAHSVHHAYATDYIPAHGLQAYLDDEVQPSIDILRDDGFAPVAYAHPGGAHTRELDQALAARIRFARSISGRPK